MWGWRAASPYVLLTRFHALTPPSMRLSPVGPSAGRTVRLAGVFAPFCLLVALYCWCYFARVVRLRACLLWALTVVARGGCVPMGATVKFVYGRRSDGCVERCRAKPENRGRGRCPHGEHVALTGAQAQEINQERLSEAVPGFHGGAGNNANSGTVEGGAAVNDAPRVRPGAGRVGGVRVPRPGGVPKPSPGVFHNSRASRPLTAKELSEQSARVSAALDEETWGSIRGLWERVNLAIADGDEEKAADSRALWERAGEKARGLFLAELDADTEDGRRLRAYLGEDVATSDVADILAFNIGQMTSPVPVKSRDTKLSRHALTAFDNDMNKSRYVMSVLAFGGRCCYCNRPLHRGEPADGQATAEHITPVNPRGGSTVRGATRYGNMALACVACNRARGNQNLEEWVLVTGRIPDREEKARCLARIREFRAYAGYEEYTAEQTKRLNREIGRMNRAYSRELEKLGEDADSVKVKAAARRALRRGVMRMRDTVHGPVGG